MFTLNSKSTLNNVALNTFRDYLTQCTIIDGRRTKQQRGTFTYPCFNYFKGTESLST